MSKNTEYWFSSSGDLPGSYEMKNLKKTGGGDSIPIEEPINDVAEAATTSEIYNNNIKSKQIYNNRYVLKIKKGHHQDVPNQICRNL
ncbi:unnamed protein product [Leptidea sinapis]|uniref:Uncharacterized protein n=1 Tax=Leptidea sinapis TaxID=189913 RepID=A0A5E4Q584_9NEOP|nr:unnamed protein product [Leptidea sinapis]